MKIFVGSLSFNTKEEKLNELFQEFGEITMVKIINDKYTGRSRGFGFVEMADDSQAAKAIEELNGMELDGRTIVVNKAEERKDNERRGNSGGRGNRGGYNKGGYNKGGYNKKGNNRDGSRGYGY